MPKWSQNPVRCWYGKRNNMDECIAFLGRDTQSNHGSARRDGTIAVLGKMVQHVKDVCLVLRWSKSASNLQTLQSFIEPIGMLPNNRVYMLVHSTM